MNLHACRTAFFIAHFVLVGVSAATSDPINKTMVEVKDGAQTILIPAGMVHVPAGKFTFGENEMRELPGYAIARFEVTNAEYKAFIDATKHREVPTAEQWEKTARGPKAFLYPWGNDKDSRYSSHSLKTHFITAASRRPWACMKAAGAPTAAMTWRATPTSGPAASS